MTGTIPSADGVTIAYETHGSGSPAVVLVHGWSCDRSYWAEQIADLARDRTVVAIDLAGHGESGLGRGEWTMSGFGGDVAAVVEALGLTRVIMAGHSMGGDVIVEAARRLPGRVAGLIWVDVHKTLDDPFSPEEHREFLAPFHADFASTTRAFVESMFAPGADAALVERVAADMSSAPTAVALPALTIATQSEREIPGLLAELKLPVIAINADNAPTDVAQLRRYGVEAQVQPRTGHFLMMEDPAGFNALLRAAIDTLSRR